MTSAWQKARQVTLVYGRMIKFSHSVFALPFALSAVLLAARNTGFSFGQFVWILIAMVAARSAAMGFNRIVDADFDAKNPRTAIREIPAGQISRPQAWGFVTAASLLFFLAAAALGPVCRNLAIPVLLVLFGYSFTKRFSLFCHFYLGVAIALSPAGAWVALTGTLNWPILLLSGILFTHIAGFDILYACQDADFDRKKGLHSIPAKLGISNALRISRITHGICFALLIAFHAAFQLNMIFFCTILIIGGLLVAEHRMVNPNDLSRVPVAFFHVNSVISMVLFFGIFLDELFWRWM